MIRNNVFAYGERSQIEPHGNLAKAPPGSTYVAEQNTVNPAKGDFRLKPGSAASQIGFQAIDVANVGPRN